MGGAIAKITPGSKEGTVNVSIKNVTSRSSLMLHVVGNKDLGKLSSKTQFFNFEIKFDKSDFKQSDEN